MREAGVLQAGVFLLVVIALVKPVGMYLERVAGCVIPFTPLGSAVGTVHLRAAYRGAFPNSNLQASFTAPGSSTWITTQAADKTPGCCGRFAMFLESILKAFAGRMLCH